MTEPSTALQEPAQSAGDDISSYAPYAQLVKMLVPSSGCTSIFVPAGELIWCSDGYEPTDFRELVDSLKGTIQASSTGEIRQTTNGITAYAAALKANDGALLGFVIIQLGTAKTSSMTPSLLRPVLECLASRMGLEQSAAQAPRTAPDNATDHLPLLLAVDEDAEGPSALQRLVAHCVENLNCISGAFLVPEKNLSVIARREVAESTEAAQLLDRTQKHLLAWVQLNNRPMVVNRVGAEAGMAPFKILSCPVRDPQNRVTGLMALFRAGAAPNFEVRDVRILEFMTRKAMSILNSQHDALTGLTNPLIFERRVRQHLGAGKEHDSSPMLFVDIDRLQLINDAFGFKAGDEVIQRLAELIRGRLGADDLACRIGGDRFAAFLPMRTEADAREMATTLIDAMANLGYLKGADAVPVSISVGIATVAQGQRDFAHLLAAAELACKRAQDAGRSRLEVYAADAALSPHRESELVAAASLKQALQNSEFRLLAQAIVDLYNDPGRLLGYEILVRMRDSSGALVSPDKFIAAAERYGLMAAVDRWVVAATVRTLQPYKDQLGELPLGIALNVSAQTLAAPDFPAFALAEINAAGLPPGSFAEAHGGGRRQPDGRYRAVHRCATDAGCHVSLDDFGTGLSSLAHLKRLKVSYLKIDGSLIRRVLEDIHAESLVRGLAQAAQTLGIPTVAEHVESAAIAGSSSSGRLAQGYFYGHPMPLTKALGGSDAPRPQR
jgi:diguanylate cyclase (GGDEF)-like protein